MQMNKYLLPVVGLIISQTCIAQLSSDAIRHASGKGPYPIYLTVQGVLASAKNTFHDFSVAYGQEYGYNKITVLGGYEANLGVAINEDHFLWIPNWRLKRASVEVGYRHLFHNAKVTGKDKVQRLHLQEEVFSFRVGMRGNLIYPVTYQLQTGPTIHNVIVVKESGGPDEPFKREQLGSGLFENNSIKKFPWGWDARVRLMVLDPVGTDGGMGFFFEYRYLWTFGGEKKGKRNLRPLYKEFGLPLIDDLQSWDYSSFSFGLIVPFAVRIK